MTTQARTLRQAVERLKDAIQERLLATQRFEGFIDPELEAILKSLIAALALPDVDPQAEQDLIDEHNKQIKPWMDARNKKGIVI